MDKPLLKLDQLVVRLREAPEDTESLMKLLDLISEPRVSYFEAGAYYSVPMRGKKSRRKEPERRTVKLVGFAGPCSRDCIAKVVCPGRLIFEDGTERCPYPPFVQSSEIRREDPEHDAAVTRAVLKVLHRGHTSGSVELLDGTVLKFQVKKPREGAVVSPSPDPE